MSRRPAGRRARALGGRTDGQALIDQTLNAGKIELARAEQRHLLCDDNLGWDHQVRNNLRFRKALKGGARRVGPLGNENKPFALARIGHGDDRRQRAWPTFRSQRFDRRQWHHLVGDLREALGAPFDRDESIAIDRDDVAGIMPAFGRGLDLAWIFPTQIAEHHVRSTYVQPAFFIDPWNRLEARVHVGHEPADRAKPIEHRGIDGENRRRLRHAIAFENPQTELFQIDIARRRL